MYYIIIITIITLVAITARLTFLTMYSSKTSRLIGSIRFSTATIWSEQIFNKL